MNDDELYKAIHSLPEPALRACLNAASKDIHVSSDSFLYARCFVVAQGEYYYHRILNCPDEFSYRWFEPLLYTPNRAYSLKTGKELERFSPINYETGTNLSLWEEE